MLDQDEFMKQMLALVKLAKAQESRITKEQVNDFCAGLELTKPQLKLVYDFLDEHNVDVAGHSTKKRAGAVSPQTGKEGSQTGEEGFQTGEGDAPDDGYNVEDSRYLKFYRRELKDLPELAKEEREALYQRLLAGEEAVMHAVIESHLKRVTVLAGKYKNRGVPLEDLIQEGNLVLIAAVDTLCGNPDVRDVYRELDRNVRGRLVELVDSHMETRNQENTIVAKTNLIHEATKVFAEEWGRLATLAELAEYTKMEEEEIQMYIDLSQDEIKVGKG